MNTKVIDIKQTARNNLRLHKDLQQSGIHIQVQAQKGPKNKIGENNQLIDRWQFINKLKC